MEIKKCFFNYLWAKMENDSGAGESFGKSA